MCLFLNPLSVNYSHDACFTSKYFRVYFLKIRISSFHKENVPSLLIPYPKVLQPSEVILLDPMLKTTWVGPSGRVVWENNLPLLCNPALGWSPQPRQPPGDTAHALGQRPEPGGRPRIGPSWKRDKSRTHEGPSVSQEWKARWQLPRDRE